MLRLTCVPVSVCVRNRLPESDPSALPPGSVKQPSDRVNRTLVQLVEPGDDLLGVHDERPVVEDRLQIEVFAGGI